MFDDSLTDSIDAPPFAHFEVERKAFEEGLGPVADGFEINGVASVVLVISEFEGNVEAGHVALAGEDHHGAVLTLDEAWVANVGEVGDWHDVDHPPVKVSLVWD